MATTFDFFLESGLTNSAGTQNVQHEIGIGGDPQDIQLFLGSNTAGRTIKALSDPGVDNIVASPANATAERANSTAYSLNALVRTASHNGYYYKATTVRGTGTTAASPPTWPTTVGGTVDDDSDPGNDGITWTNQGKIHEPEEMKISTSQVGLDSAVAGASLSLGTSISSDSAPTEIWVRLTDATDTVLTQTELSIQLNEVQEES